MTEIKQICIHYLNDNCKYGNKCNKVHTISTPELLDSIDKKGLIVCTYYPNCKFTSKECKKIHIPTFHNTEISDITDFNSYYYKIIEYKTDDLAKLALINNVKKLIKLDTEMLKDSYDTLINNK
jgi:hypothetical protein